MAIILQIVLALCILTIFITMMIKSFLHFKFLRIKHGKVGDFADYVNVSFKMKESINYIECALPVPILIKEKSERLERLRIRINKSLLVVLIAFLILFAFAVYVAIKMF